MVKATWRIFFDCCSQGLGGLPCHACLHLPSKFMGGGNACNILRAPSCESSDNATLNPEASWCWGSQVLPTSPTELQCWPIRSTHAISKYAIAARKSPLCRPAGRYSYARRSGAKTRPLGFIRPSVRVEWAQVLVAWGEAQPPYVASTRRCRNVGGRPHCCKGPCQSLPSVRQRTRITVSTNRVRSNLATGR